MTARDWLIGILNETPSVISATPIENDFIHVHHKNNHHNVEYPPFTMAVISTQLVNQEALEPLLNRQDIQFVCNIPKASLWAGSAISTLDDRNIGWGGVGDLTSAMQGGNVSGFKQRKYRFVERGLQQHSRVSGLTPHYDTLIEIERYNLPPITVALIYAYELTVEHVRHAIDTYGDFSIILNTNPNGNSTTAATDLAKELNIEIFKWGAFLGRLNKR